MVFYSRCHNYVVTERRVYFLKQNKKNLETKSWYPRSSDPTEFKLCSCKLLKIAFCFFISVSNRTWNDILKWFQKTVLKSIEKDYPSFTGDGYTSQSIIYIMFAVCNWIAPSIINAIGSRKSMFLGSIMYMYVHYNSVNIHIVWDLTQWPRWTSTSPGSGKINVCIYIRGELCRVKYFLFRILIVRNEK